MKATGLIILVALPCSWGTTIPRTYYVSPTGSASYPFSTPETAATVIQDAVDAAEYGDVVQLMPAEYRQRVVLKPGVSFWGSGSDSTVIIALDTGWHEVAVTGAEAAEIRGIGFLCEQTEPSTYPHAVDLGPYANQVVAGCLISGPFDLGIGLSGAAGGPALIYDCTFDGPGGGIRTGGAAGVIVDSCRFSQTGVGAGGLVVLRRCAFTPGGLSVQRGDVVMDSCLFARPSGYSGAVFLEGDCSLRMTNCVLSWKGLGLVVNSADNVEIYNSTFVNESQAIYCDSAAKVTLRNSILWGPPSQLDSVKPASFDVEYCDVAGGWEGEENIDSEPMFVDPDKADFRLRPESPCVDAGPFGGEPAWVSGVDFTGRPRVMYGGRSERRRPDMGAYEYYINRVSHGPLPGETTLTWSCTVNETYSVFYSDDLLTWHVAADSVGPGYHEVVLSWTDDGSNTGVPPSLAPRRFYRVLENW
jgi:hypothetical protein